MLKETAELIFDLHFMVPPHNLGAGGLTPVWRKEINLQVLSSEQNHIDSLISYKNLVFNSTFIYGAPVISKRQAVCQLLTNISETRNVEPWFLTGDFNEITDNTEKAGGKERLETSFTHFRAFLSACDLFDIKHTGNFLSWRGKRHTHLVYCRLDRAFANTAWSYCFPNSKSHYLKFEGSDHRPIVSTFDKKKKRPHKLFRYDRRLRDNMEVKQLVEKVWIENNHLSIALRISCCRKAISIWSK